MAISKLLTAINASHSMAVMAISSKPIPNPPIPITSSPDVKSVMMLADSGISTFAIQKESAPAPPVIMLSPPEVV